MAFLPDVMKIRSIVFTAYQNRSYWYRHSIPDKIVLNEVYSYSHHDLSLLLSEEKQFVIAVGNVVCGGNRFFTAKLCMLLKWCFVFTPATDVLCQLTRQSIFYVLPHRWCCNFSICYWAERGFESGVKAKV